MIEKVVIDFSLALLDILQAMAPYLLLGFIFAGILHVFFPKKIMNKYLGKRNWKSVFYSLIIGIPLPLCSCGVIPTAVGMRKKGASKGATTAFLIATPQTGIDSILATSSLLGLPFAIIRPLVALFTGFLGGLLSNLFDKEDDKFQSVNCELLTDELNSNYSFARKIKAVLDYGFTQMLMDIGLWLTIGLLLAAFITVIVPNGFLEIAKDYYFLSYLVILLISCPMYVCATGSIPIALALMLKGLSPGCALVFLMAGPSTNLASMLILAKTMGKRSLLIYLSTIVVGAILFGVLIDLFLPLNWFEIQRVVDNEISHCCVNSSMGIIDTFDNWVNFSLTVLFVILLTRAMLIRYYRKPRYNQNKMLKEFKIDGMMCNHCKAHVENAIKQVDGVTKVEVNLSAGTASVEGNFDSLAIVKSVVDCGYSCIEK